MSWFPKTVIQKELGQNYLPRNFKGSSSYLSYSQRLISGKKKMIDTIKLTLDKTMFTVLEPERFVRGKMNAARGNYSLVQNPTRLELLNGNYKPRLTITNRFNCSGRSEETLSIELSLPKLVFGNNFDELRDNDFDQVVSLLLTKLRGMGVGILVPILLKAPVSAVHYSKNIPLTDGKTPYHYISKFRQSNVSLWLDTNEADYRNDGHSFKLHCNSYEVIFYDKIRDAEAARKGDRRAIENDNAIQLGLFDELQRQHKFEVLRMEVRLNQRQKLGHILRCLGINLGLTFQNLFSSKVSQAVLLHYLNETEKHRPRLVDYQTKSPMALLSDLVLCNPSLGLKKTLQLFGLKTALESAPTRELRVMFRRQSKRTWYRLMAEAGAVNLPAVANPFKAILENLNVFEPLKLVDFQNGMLNNDK